jgi:hypothetical protein
MTNEETVRRPLGKIILQKLSAASCVWLGDVRMCLSCTSRALAARDQRPPGAEWHSSRLAHRDHADSRLKPVLKYDVAGERRSHTGAIISETNQRYLMHETIGL